MAPGYGDNYGDDGPACVNVGASAVCSQQERSNPLRNSDWVHESFKPKLVWQAPPMPQSFLYRAGRFGTVFTQRHHRHHWCENARVLTRNPLGHAAIGARDQHQQSCTIPNDIMSFQYSSLEALSEKLLNTVDFVRCLPIKGMPSHCARVELIA